MWSLDGFATVLEYLAPIQFGDQKIGRYLAGWDNPTLQIKPMRINQLKLPENKAILDDFITQIFINHWPKLKTRAFGEVLAVSLIIKRL
jgi:hypothetical protein